MAINQQSVQAWLDKYVQAWKSYDPQAIGDLYSEDAVNYYGAFDEPQRGRAAIVESWLKSPDAKGTYDASYHPIAIDGNLAITNGRSRYFEADGKTFRMEFDNIFVLRFDDTGRCVEFREWYTKKPSK